MLSVPKKAPFFVTNIWFFQQLCLEIWFSLKHRFLQQSEICKTDISLGKKMLRNKNQAKVNACFVVYIMNLTWAFANYPLIYSDEALLLKIGSKQM